MKKMLMGILLMVSLLVSVNSTCDATWFGHHGKLVWDTGSINITRLDSKMFEFNVLVYDGLNKADTLYYSWDTNTQDIHYKYSKSTSDKIIHLDNISKEDEDYYYLYQLVFSDACIFTTKTHIGY